MDSKFGPHAGDPFMLYVWQRSYQEVVRDYDRRAVGPTDRSERDQSEPLTEGEEIDLLGPL